LGASSPTHDGLTTQEGCSNGSLRGGDHRSRRSAAADARGHGPSLTAVRPAQLSAPDQRPSPQAVVGSRISPASDVTVGQGFSRSFEAARLLRRRGGFERAVRGSQPPRSFLERGRSPRRCRRRPHGRRHSGAVRAEASLDACRIRRLGAQVIARIGRSRVCPRVSTKLQKSSSGTGSREASVGVVRDERRTSPGGDGDLVRSHRRRGASLAGGPAGEEGAEGWIVAESHTRDRERDQPCLTQARGGPSTTEGTSGQEVRLLFTERRTKRPRRFGNDARGESRALSAESDGGVRGTVRQERPEEHAGSPNQKDLPKRVRRRETPDPPVSWSRVQVRVPRARRKSRRVAGNSRGAGTRTW